MELIDVAVQSYNKPESLVYTLLSLKKHCGQYIDTIYIRDDRSRDGVVSIYQSAYFLQAMAPIRISVTVNEKKGSFDFVKVKDAAPLGANEYRSDDIRYQYAINHTDKKYLLLIHDDILFCGDFLCKYLELMETGEYGLIGDLGQCWRCPESTRKKCNPEKISAGFKPSVFYPRSLIKRYRRKIRMNLPHLETICRVNEWCCLMDMETAKQLKKKDIYFGQYESCDIGCYYYAYMLKHTNKRACDPFAKNSREYYLHCWQGHAGHSVWVDQGNGIQKYDAEMIIQKLKDDFDFDYAQCLNK